MTTAARDGPFGVRHVAGVLHRRSPAPVAETIERLTAAISGAGTKVFTTIDHSGEAARAGLSLRDTKLLIFGSPKAGTPAMEVTPLAALDLPLKLLVWQDDAEAVWMSYLSAAWLTERHGIPAELGRPLQVVETLTNRVAGSS